MDLHYKQEVSVGLLVIVAIIIIFAGMTYLTGKSFGTGQVTFAARFDNIAGLSIGDPVQISGVRVGRVAGVDLAGLGDVTVSFEVDERVAPRVDARVMVRALDAFVGGMFIDYAPGRSEERLNDGQILRGSREVQLMENATVLADQASGVLTGAEALLSQRTADDVHATLVATQRAMNAIAQMGSGPAMRAATSALERLAIIADRLDSTLASPDLTRSIAQFDEIAENLNEMIVGLGGATQALARIMEKIDSDSGSFGRLVNDTTMYSEMVRLTISMRELLDDMRERPGRYFNLKVF